MYHFEDYFPSVEHDGAESHSPCPFCPPSSGAAVRFRGVTFVGDDRMVWFHHNSIFWCRHCQVDGRGRNGAYTVVDMLRQLGLSEEDASVFSEGSGEGRGGATKPINLLSERMVDIYHRNIDRGYWKRFGWDNATMDRFQLGRGELSVDTRPMHIIPTRLQSILKDEPEDAYFPHGRMDDGGKRHAPGSIKDYLWLIPSTESLSRRLVVTEGEKDAITASLLFPEADIVAFFGVNHYSRRHALWLARERLYDDAFVLGDNDDSGAAFNRQVARHLNDLGIKARYIEWENRPDSFDLTDLFRQGDARSYVMSHLSDVANQFLPQEPITFTEDTDTYLPLEAVRGEGFHSLYYKMREFYNGYADNFKWGEGDLKLIASPPGAGKTHAAMRLVLEVAKEARQASTEELQTLKEQLDYNKKRLASTSDDEERAIVLDVVEHLEKKIADFDHSRVLWVGQYKDGFDDLLAIIESIDPDTIDMIYNYEGRNPDNCANFDMARTLGENRHDVGKFCTLGCPFRDNCAYLAQDEQRRQAPIVYLRHQHLRAPIVRESNKKLIIIDENPTGIAEEPIWIEAKDIYPFDEAWETDPLYDTIREPVQRLTRAIRLTLNINIGRKKEERVSGKNVLKLIDGVLNGALEDTLNAIPLPVIRDVYQPSFVAGDKDSVRPRVMPGTIQALKHELENYILDGDKPPILHIEGGKLKFFELDTIHIPSPRPIIVLDATPLPMTYRALFDRNVTVYAPKIKNPNAHIALIVGSDWTRGSIKREIGRFLSVREMERREAVYDKQGNQVVVDKETLPDVYNSKIVRQVSSMVLEIAGRHEDLLVVTYKFFKPLLEEILYDTDEKWRDRVTFAHYGSLRGTNSFANYRAVLLIGVPRVPYDNVWEVGAMWANRLSVNTSIPNETHRLKKPYPGVKDKVGTLRTFASPLLQQLVEQIEVGEMVQCLNRIRPHSSEEDKYVYIACTRPTIRPTEITNKQDFYNTKMDNRIIKANQFIDEYVKEHGTLPSLRTIRKGIGGGSLSTIKKVVDEHPMKVLQNNATP